jgi:hypothetical protein
MAIMKTQDTTHEAPASGEQIAQRFAQLERRLAVHDEILSFLITVLGQLKESGYRLVLTDAQRTELNRWLDGYQKEGRLPLPKVN